MSRCKHNRSVAVTEKGSWFTEHYVDFESMDVDHNNEPGGYIATVEVRCMDCGQRAKGRKRTLPGWALHAFEVALDVGYYGFTDGGDPPLRPTGESER